MTERSYHISYLTECQDCQLSGKWAYCGLIYSTREMQKAGWQAIFDNFKNYAETIGKCYDLLRVFFHHQYFCAPIVTREIYEPMIFSNLESGGCLR